MQLLEYFIGKHVSFMCIAKPGFIIIGNSFTFRIILSHRSYINADTSYLSYLLYCLEQVKRFRALITRDKLATDSIFISCF